MVRRISLVCLGIMLLAGANAVFAQGVQTATLVGTVTTSDGAPLPGVTVTVRSKALMGVRTTVSTGTGDYNLPGLSPGDYTITFGLEGMQTVTRNMTLALGLPTRVDAMMKVSGITEAITVTAATPTVLENQTVGANIKNETVMQLPINRTPV